METPRREPTNHVVNDAILKEISNTIRRLAFGTITIKINHSRIVQIEVAENRRFDEKWSVEGGGGI